jgi:hypothetical protein
MKLKPIHAISALFILYFAIRIFFALQTDYFSNDYSYFALRQIESIEQSGKPIFYDELSYSGRTFVFMPLYFYILSFFTMFLPQIAAIKVINNLFASTIVFAVYLVASDVIKNKRIAFACAAVAATVPAYISETINTISPFSLVFPGSFFLIFLFLRLDKHRDELGYLILLTLALTLVSSSVFLILFGLIIYLVLNNLENFSLERVRLEYMAFFLFFFMWTSFLIYKSAFQEHGFSLIWSNLPQSVIMQYFTSINITQAVASIGFLPFVFGFYTLYRYLFKRKNAKILLFISLFVSTFTLFWLRLVKAELALMFLGASLIILFGQFLADFAAGLKQTKFERYSGHIFSVIVALLVITQALPGIFLMSGNISQTYSADYIEGFLWLRENTPDDSVIFSVPEEGHLITYFGQRKNVMDTEYLLVKDVEQRNTDIKTAYTHKFTVEAIRILNKYEASYIIFSEKTREKFNITSIPHIADSCVQLVYDETITIFQVKGYCELKKL